MILFPILFTYIVTKGLSPCFLTYALKVEIFAGV